jgi:LPXTG-motif cell wall-anchored protein
MTMLTATTSTGSHNVNLLPFLILIVLLAGGAVVVFLRERKK